MYEKCYKVITSCTNLIQIESAEKYLMLAASKLPRQHLYALKLTLESRESALKSKKRFA